MKIMAYKRENGEIGIRNHLLVLSSVICANDVVRKIGEQLKSAVPITHQNGCAEITNEDRERVKRTLIGFGSNPNVGACIVVGLGCEDIQAADIAAEISKTGKPVRCLSIQEYEGTLQATAAGVQMGQEMLIYLSTLKREECDLSQIILGLECGASDILSGAVANPVLAKMTERFLSEGGTAVQSEVCEHIGGERHIVEHAAAAEAGEAFLRMMKEWDMLAKQNNVCCSSLTESNRSSGISTMEEKSLSCILKAGDAKLQEVIGFAEKPSKKGFVIMDTPGADMESVTGLAASGMQLICFSTSKGTPTSSPVCPTIKVCANPDVFQRMRDNMDFNAGELLLGEKDICDLGEELFREVLEVCNGKETKAEILGYGDFAIMTRSFTF